MVMCVRLLQAQNPTDHGLIPGLGGAKTGNPRDSVAFLTWTRLTGCAETRLRSREPRTGPHSHRQRTQNLAVLRGQPPWMDPADSP